MRTGLRPSLTAEFAWGTTVFGHFNGRSAAVVETWNKRQPSETCSQTLEDQLDFLGEEKETWQNGVSWPVIFSIVVHALLITWFFLGYHPVTNGKASQPIPRYISLLKQNPEFVEAPGKKVATAPLTAPYSDANRKAAMPKPTGDKATQRPGEGGLYTPSAPRGARQEATSTADQAAQAAEEQRAEQSPAPSKPPADTLTYRPRTATTQAAAAGRVDWKSAIKEVGKVASLGGDQGIDLGNASGGERGYGETGPLSFESQWFDWGDYAQSMVSRIRVNWYAKMPELIKSGIKGVVTIRFTIRRDGAISDVTIVSSSGVPPYDFAAKKAIELSSPLNSLPADFPKESERVTCMFFYNQEPPAR